MGRGTRVNFQATCIPFTKEKLVGRKVKKKHEIRVFMRVVMAFHIEIVLKLFF